MADAQGTVIICSCEGTMPLAGEAVSRACGGALIAGDQFCGRELDRFRAVIAQGGPVTVACTQEEPLFREAAADLGREDGLVFVNLRETAGWSDEAERAGPKMAALAAAAQVPMEEAATLSLESGGVTLIYGRGEAALNAARQLADRLDLTLILTHPEEVTPPRVMAFPLLAGRVRSARGHLGAFEVIVDGCARPQPSSRGRLEFLAARDGAVSRCDVLLDLSGGPPLFPAPALRPGYVRADPRDPAAVAHAAFEAAHLVGTFDKLRYVSFTPELCAHSRSRIVGCRRCLDLCPTGAISPDGDHVAIDAAICAGCGACAAACPTGAAAYALPPADALMRRLRALLLGFRQAGGKAPVVLLHDGDHGEALIDALARFGHGLPAHVLPLRVQEVTQLGPEIIAAAFAYGAAGLRVLCRERPAHDRGGLVATVAMMTQVLTALGFGEAVAGLIETDDPDTLRARLDAAALGTASPVPATFMPLDGKRRLLELSFRALHEAALTPVDTIPLEAGAPFGTVVLDQAACTLCLACVSACPTAALSDDPDRPMLRFTESLCVQCGLCAATCPEDAIGLVPQIDFAAWRNGKRTLKEEEPFACTSCGTPFGTRSTIERIRARLAEKHWMFSGANRARLDLLTLCEDCRVEKVVNEGLDPHGAPARPRPRTAEDFREGLSSEPDETG